MKGLIFALVILNTSLFGQKIVTGKAVNVYDGDTFTLLLNDQTKLKIRMSGIDAPEIQQKHGLLSRDFARKLILNKKVTVYLESELTYGRGLGVVITPSGKHFNYEMVINGHAWHYAYFNKDKFLKEAVLEAKNKNIGLWKNPEPVAPWNWRKTKKE